MLFHSIGQQHVWAKGVMEKWFDVLNKFVNAEHFMEINIKYFEKNIYFTNIL